VGLNRVNYNEVKLRSFVCNRQEHFGFTNVEVLGDKIFQIFMKDIFVPGVIYLIGEVHRVFGGETRGKGNTWKT
jgi:hypothetical protein